MGIEPTRQELQSCILPLNYKPPIFACLSKLSRCYLTYCLNTTTFTPSTISRVGLSLNLNRHHRLDSLYCLMGRKVGDVRFELRLIAPNDTCYHYTTSPKKRELKFSPLIKYLSFSLNIFDLLLRLPFL